MYAKEMSKDQSANDTSLCTSPQQLNVFLHLTNNSPSKQHCKNDDVNDQLQLLVKESCDVFQDDLPFGLPFERTITHGIDLLRGGKPDS